MATLLHVSASPRGAGSHSRQVARELIAAIAAQQPGLGIVERDLTLPALPHIDATFAAASLMRPVERGAAERQVLALSEALIVELAAADFLVISAPLHNFTVPSALKAWLDHVVRPGRTFRSTPTGKVGLLAPRPVFAVIACGGPVADDGTGPPDFLSPYLRYVLGTIGLPGLDLLHLAELARGPQKVAEARTVARQWIGSRAAASGARAST